MFGAIGGIVSGIAGIIGAQQAAKERAKVREMIEQWGRQGVDAGYRGLDSQYDSLEALIQNALDQEQFSRASRVDPYGNRMFYDKDSNEWSYELTPMQQRLLGASQDEQLKQLTTDNEFARIARQYAFNQNLDTAAANRGVMAANTRAQQMQMAINNFTRNNQMRGVQRQQAENERRAVLNRGIDNSIRDTLADNERAATLNPSIRDLNKRSIAQSGQILNDNQDVLDQNKLARDQNERITRRLGNIGDETLPDYDRALSEYRYQKPASEGAITNDLMRLVAQSMGGGERLMREYQGRDMARRGGNTPIVIGGGGGLPEESFGPQIAQTMLQARNQGVQEAASRSAAHENKYASILQRLQGQLSLGQRAPQQFGAPSPIMPYAQQQGAPISPIGAGQTGTNTFGNPDMAGLYQNATIPGGQDSTGAVVGNLNAMETNMANAIANAMGVEANALNSGYGRIGQSYQNITNNYGNLIRGIASTMPSGGGGGGGGAAGGIGSIFKGLGGLFGG